MMRASLDVPELLIVFNRPEKTRRLFVVTLNWLSPYVRRGASLILERMPRPRRAAP
jgi:hypothetical protein